MIVIMLKELAQAKGYENATQFQRASGMSVGTSRRWWDNDTNGADFEVLEQICEFLQCEPGDLIKRVKKE